MVKKIIDKINGGLEGFFRRLLGRLSPGRRVILVVVMFLAFSLLSIWMTFSSIYHFGKDKREQLRMEHIQRLELEPRQKEYETDSIKQLNQIDYGKE